MALFLVYYLNMDRKGKRITVIGATNTDISGKCLFQMVMKDSNIGKVTTSLGGVGHNVAMNLSLLGSPVTFITAIANDGFGLNAKREMERVMDISHSVFCNKRSGVYLYVTDENGDMQLAVNDMEITKEITPSFLESKREIIETSPFLILDANLEEGTILSASSMAKGMVLADAVSTLKTSRLVSSLPYIDVLKPNLMELEYLAGFEIKDLASIKRAGFSLLDKGVGAVLATDGKNGSYYISSSLFLHSGIKEVEVVNTNGSGDSFLSGFAYGLSLGMEEKEALSYASAAACITVMGEETVSDRMESSLLKEFSKEIEVEEIP